MDQFFLNDQKVINDMVSVLEPCRRDIVLEIGAGSGVVTRELTKKSGEVVAIEIDKNFAKDLKQIPGNIQLIFDDALKVLKDKKKYSLKFNKVIGSLPSSIVEPLMHVLIGTGFELAVFLVPLKFAHKLVGNQVFTAYFDIAIIEKISRKSFLPVPRTNWAMIKMVKKPSPLKTGEITRFLRQYLYTHSKAKSKNALIEGLIRYYRVQGKLLTKKQAKEIIVAKNPL